MNLTYKHTKSLFKCHRIRLVRHYLYRFYRIQALLHCCFVCCLQIVYNRLKTQEDHEQHDLNYEYFRHSNNNNNYNDNTTETINNNIAFNSASIKQLMHMLSPMEPDIFMATIVTYSIYASIALFMAELPYWRYGPLYHLKDMPILKYLTLGKQADGMINSKLNCIIDELISSNQNYTRRLADWQPLISYEEQFLLNEELNVLIELRKGQQRDLIWPRDRCKQYIKFQKEFFAYFYMITHAFSFIITAMIYFTFTHATIVYRRVELISWQPSFWSMKFACEMLASTLLFCEDNLCQLVGLNLCAHSQFVLNLQYNYYVEKFLHLTNINEKPTTSAFNKDNYNNKRFLLSNKQAEMQNSKDNQKNQQQQQQQQQRILNRYECHKMSIVCYIRLRYLLDQLNANKIAFQNYFNPGTTAILSCLIITIISYRDLNWVENNLLSYYRPIALMVINPIYMTAAFYQASSVKLLYKSQTIFICQLLRSSKLHSHTYIRSSPSSLQGNRVKYFQLAKISQLKSKFRAIKSRYQQQQQRANSNHVDSHYLRRDIDIADVNILRPHHAINRILKKKLSSISDNTRKTDKGNNDKTCYTNHKIKSISIENSNNCGHLTSELMISSSHVRLLWQRLVINQSALARSLTIRIFNVFELNYGTVIKANLLAIYIIILNMTYRKK